MREFHFFFKALHWGKTPTWSGIEYTPVVLRDVKFGKQLHLGSTWLLPQSSLKAKNKTKMEEKKKVLAMYISMLIPVMDLLRFQFKTLLHESFLLETSAATPPLVSPHWSLLKVLLR